MLVSALAALQVEGARVFYINQPENGFGRINAVRPDGSGHTTLLTTTTVTDLRGIAVDPVGDRLFYAHADSDPTLARTQVSIRTLASTGGADSIIATFPDGTFISDVEWDEVNGRIYFAQTSDLQLRRVKPNGTELATVLTHTAAGQGPYFFGLDLVANDAYWAVVTVPNETNTGYSRGSLTTGQVDPNFTLVTPSRTRDIAVDHTGTEARLYWCDRQNGAVYNRLASGGTVLTSRTGLNAPHGLVLDIEAGKGYVADTGKRGNNPTQPSAHRAVRFDLDGSGALEFLSPIDTSAEPWDIAIDTTSASYADWRTRYFSTTAPNSGPTEDADGDGRANVFEYAFFSHPGKADAHRQAVSAVPGGFRFARRLVSDLTLRVEVSADLQTWHWNGDTAGAVWTTETGSASRDADSEWVTVLPAGAFVGAPNLFFRLRATQATQAPGVKVRARKLLRPRNHR